MGLTYGKLRRSPGVKEGWEDVASVPSADPLKFLNIEHYK